MDENKFWLSFYGLAAVVLMMLIWASFDYNTKKNTMLLQVDDASCFKMAIIDGSLQSTYTTCMNELLIKSK